MNWTEFAFIIAMLWVIALAPFAAWRMGQKVEEVSGHEWLGFVTYIAIIIVIPIVIGLTA